MVDVPSPNEDKISNWMIGSRSALDGMITTKDFINGFERFLKDPEKTVPRGILAMELRRAEDGIDYWGSGHWEIG